MELRNSVRFSSAAFFKIVNELLQIVRHGVEGLRQFAEFCAALQANTMLEITAGNGAAGFGQHIQVA